MRVITSTQAGPRNLASERFRIFSANANKSPKTKRFFRRSNSFSNTEAAFQFPTEETEDNIVGLSRKFKSATNILDTGKNSISPACSPQSQCSPSWKDDVSESPRFELQPQQPKRKLFNRLNQAIRGLVSPKLIKEKLYFVSKMKSPKVLEPEPEPEPDIFDPTSNAYFATRAAPLSKLSPPTEVHSRNHSEVNPAFSSWQDLRIKEDISRGFGVEKPPFQQKAFKVDKHREVIVMEENEKESQIDPRFAKFMAGGDQGSFRGRGRSFSMGDTLPTASAVQNNSPVVHLEFRDQTFRLAFYNIGKKSLESLEKEGKNEES